MGAQTSCTVSVTPPGENVTPWTIRRNPHQANGPYVNPPETQTMQDFAKTQFKDYADRPYLGTRHLPGGKLSDTFVYKTYRECQAISEQLGSGLAHKEIVSKSFLGIYSINCPEWLNTIDASSLYGFVIVSLYDSLGQDALSYLIKHSKMKGIICSAQNAEKLMKILIETPGEVKLVILIEDVPVTPTREKLQEMNIEVTTFQAILELGKQSPVDYPEIKPEDPHFICYSSGTTGNPKGVIITHQMAVSNYLASSETIDTRNGRYLSYLPLAHVFERAAVATFARHGSSIGFITNGDVRNLTTDMGILKPTVFCAVPRVMNRFYEGVQKNIQGSAIKKALFYGSWYIKRWCIPRSIPTGFLDFLVFGKVNKLMGGQVQQFIVGGAALDPGTHEFLQVATGIPIRAGYGLTEAGSGNICNPRDIRHIKPGTVGGPLQNCEVRLEPIEDYDDPECGEILLGGQCCSPGYLYDEVSTQNLFTDPSRQWIHTGDVGKWDQDGYLRVVDRMRSIFKLSQGEYVAAELVTEIYAKADLVTTIFVYGDSSRTCLVAVVNPPIGAVAKFLGKERITDEEYERACQSAELKAAVQQQLNKQAKDNGLFGYQYIKNVYLTPEEWTIDNDLMTPTFKLKRKKLQEKYMPQIEAMYAELEPQK